MTVELKRYTFDPKLVKQKYLWEAVFFSILVGKAKMRLRTIQFFNIFCKQTTENINNASKISALPIKGQKCFILELEPFLSTQIGIGHPD